MLNFFENIIHFYWQSNFILLLSTCKKCKRNAVLQEINAVLKDNGFELVSEYTGYDDTIFVRCKNNHVVDMLYDNIKKGNKCRKCNNKVLPEYSFMKNYKNSNQCA